MSAEPCPPRGELTLILALAMAVTPFLNNAATVLVVAPIGASFAGSLGYRPEAFLMAVAIGAGCDFLTPIGHQCNTLVMGPGLSGTTPHGIGGSSRGYGMASRLSGARPPHMRSPRGERNPARRLAFWPGREARGRRWEIAGRPRGGATRYSLTNRSGGRASRLRVYRSGSGHRTLLSLGLILNGSERPMRRDGDGWWQATAAARAGDDYSFRLEDGTLLADPAAREMSGGAGWSVAPCRPCRLRLGQPRLARTAVGGGGDL